MDEKDFREFESATKTFLKYVGIVKGGVSDQYTKEMMDDIDALVTLRLGCIREAVK